MEFRIYATSSYKNDILTKYPCLFNCKKVRIEPGEYVNKVYITIDTLEELINLQSVIGTELIIDSENNIEIYDDWRE